MQKDECEACPLYGLKKTLGSLYGNNEGVINNTELFEDLDEFLNDIMQTNDSAIIEHRERAKDLYYTLREIRNSFKPYTPTT